MGNSASSSTEEIPTEMKRFVLSAPGPSVAECKFATETVPVPVPRSGEVLIRVVATPVNPSDYAGWSYTPAADCPKAIGNEGSGIVVATGGGMMNFMPVGTKVGFAGLKGGQGAYSEYVVANANSAAFAMPSDLAIEDAASFFVNPYTAVGILDTVRKQGTKAFVHTAAASQLGQMMVKLAKEDGDLTIINVVRREEQAEILRGHGATHVVVTGGNEGWKAELKAMIKETDATVAFDAVAGEMCGDLLGVLPAKGKLFVYGGLAGAIKGINPIHMIYHAKQFEGWLLTRWILAGGMLSMLPRMRSATARVAGGLHGGWSSSTFLDTTLEEMQGAMVALQKDGFTGAKLRIRFDGAADAEKI